MHILDINNFIILENNNDKLYLDISYNDPCSKLPSGSQIYVPETTEPIISEALNNNLSLKEYVKKKLSESLKFNYEELLKQINENKLCFETTNTFDIKNLNVTVEGKTINVPVISSSVNISNDNVQKTIKNIKVTPHGLITSFTCDNDTEKKYLDSQKEKVSSKLNSGAYTIGSPVTNNGFIVYEYQFINTLTLETKLIIKTNIFAKIIGDLEFELVGGSTKDYGPVFTAPGQGGGQLEDQTKQKERDDAECLDKIQEKNKALTFTIVELQNLEVSIEVPISLAYNLISESLIGIEGIINDPRDINFQYYQVENEAPKLLKDFPNNFKPNRYFTVFNGTYLLSTDIEDIKENIDNSNLIINFNSDNIKIKELPPKYKNDIINILSTKASDPKDNCCCVKWKLKNETFSNLSLSIDGKIVK